MFRTRDHQGADMFLAKITLLKTLSDRLPYTNLMLWQHVVLCRSCVAKRHTLGDTTYTIRHAVISSNWYREIN